MWEKWDFDSLSEYLAAQTNLPACVFSGIFQSLPANELWLLTEELLK